MIRQYGRLIREAAESGVPGSRVGGSPFASTETSGRRWFADGRHAAVSEGLATAAAVERAS